MTKVKIFIICIIVLGAFLSMFSGYRDIERWGDIASPRVTFSFIE
jgi:hypothetical protein